MNVAGISVLLAAAAAIGGLAWFFFGPRRARSAQMEGGVQRAVVTVKGGYSPDVIRLRQGVPAQLVFDRQESGDCTSRVVFPDFLVSAALPAFQRTTVRLTPASAGTFGFACGMNMVHGTLVVEPADELEPGRLTHHRPPLRKLLPCPRPAASKRRREVTRRRPSGGQRSPTWPAGSWWVRC